MKRCINWLIRNFASVLIQFSLFQSFLQVVNPALSASFESSFFPDLSPSSVVTAENEQTDKIPVNFAGSNDLVKGSACSVEAEIAVDFLRRALSQVLQSTDVDHQSKKLLDASMRIIVEDFVAIPQEQDHIAQLISAKSLVLSLCFFLWIIILALAFFFGSGAKSSFSGPPPTWSGEEIPYSSCRSKILIDFVVTGIYPFSCLIPLNSTWPVTSTYTRNLLNREIL